MMSMLVRRCSTAVSELSAACGCDATQGRGGGSALTQRFRLGLGVASSSALVALYWLLVLGASSALADSCPNAAFRVGPSAGLPDCRAYEMVTPASKPAGVLVPSGGFAGGVTSDGNHYFFGAEDPLIDNAPDQPLIYRADRGPSGWSVVSPVGAASDSGSMDLNHYNEANLSIVASTNRSYDAADTYGGLYGFDASGAPTWLSRGQINNDDPSAAPTFMASTPDAGHVVFSTGAPLVPAANGVAQGDYQLYDSVGGSVSLVGVDNSGGLLTDGNEWLGSSISGRISINALSQDGSKVFFTAENDPFFSPNTSDSAPGLYVRENGETTVPVPPSLPPSTDHRYLGATPDGSKVFFATAQQLTPDDTDTSYDLYQYDFSDGALTRLSAGPSPANVDYDYPVYTSDDGSRVYFVASGDLVPGEGTPGAPKTFLWDHGQLKFVADAPATSVGVFTDAEQCSGTRITPDGRYLLFTSSAHLTPGAAADTSQDVYRYDAVTGKLILISHGPAGGVGADGAFINPTSLLGGAECDSSSDHPTNAISTDGTRVFFETQAALVPQDTNDRTDVYEWEAEGSGSCTQASSGFDSASDGCLYLISAGTGSEDSHFLDATPSGSDVFFVTSDQLVPQDTDSLDDIYDARIGGGFAPPPPAGIPCSDSDCQGPPGAVPAPPTVVSITFTGPGNPSTNPRTRVKLLTRTVRGTRFVVRVQVSGAGRITIGGSRIRTTRRSVARAGTYRLKVALKPTARRALAREHKLKLTLQVRYASARGSVEAARVRLTVVPAARRAVRHATRARVISYDRGGVR